MDACHPKPLGRRLVAGHTVPGASEGRRLEVPVGTGQTAGCRRAGGARRGACQAAVARQVPAPLAGGADTPVATGATGRGARAARAPGEPVAFRAGVARDPRPCPVCRAHGTVWNSRETVLACHIIARAAIGRSRDRALRRVVSLAARAACGGRCAAEATRRAGDAFAAACPEALCRTVAGAQEHPVQSQRLASTLARQTDDRAHAISEAAPLAAVDPCPSSACPRVVAQQAPAGAGVGRPDLDGILVASYARYTLLPTEALRRADLGDALFAVPDVLWDAAGASRACTRCTVVDRARDAAVSGLVVRHWTDCMAGHLCPGRERLVARETVLAQCGARYLRSLTEPAATHSHPAVPARRVRAGKTGSQARRGERAKVSLGALFAFISPHTIARLARWVARNAGRALEIVSGPASSARVGVVYARAAVGIGAAHAALICLGKACLACSAPGRRLRGVSTNARPRRPFLCVAGALEEEHPVSAVRAHALAADKSLLRLCARAIQRNLSVDQAAPADDLAVDDHCIALIADTRAGVLACGVAAPLVEEVAPSARGAAALLGVLYAWTGK